MRLSYQSKPLNELALLCLKRRLYVRGWSLKSTLRWIREAPTKQAKTTLIVAFHKGIPIGLVCSEGYKYSKNRVFVAYYVKSHYRRQGVGRKLTRELKRKLGSSKKLIATPGVVGSQTFLKRMKVFC